MHFSFFYVQCGIPSQFNPFNLLSDYVSSIAILLLVFNAGVVITADNYYQLHITICM